MKVLSNAQVNELIGSLDKDVITRFQDVLLGGLKHYGQDPSIIPQRIVTQWDQAVHLFMPSLHTRVGVKTLAGSKEGFKGSISIINETNGNLIGVLNAQTITAFRTALASTIPLMKVYDGGDVLTVFGNGLQAYWHVELTLALFPLKTVQVAVRTRNEKAVGLQERIQKEHPDVEVILVDENTVDLKTSSIIYGCVPSTEAKILLSKLDLTKKIYISIIGSYKPHMFEVDDELVQHALSKGKIIVDSYEHTLHEAGELIRNNITTKDVIEIGELENIVFTDFTLVKIVGLAIMDISVGTELLQLADDKNIGSVVDF